MDLITEMSDVFSQDSNDIGDVRNCKMKIRLKDETQVQKSYYSMSKPLHQEVKIMLRTFQQRMDNQIVIKLFITRSSSKEKTWLSHVVLRLHSLRQQDHI